MKTTSSLLLKETLRPHYRCRALFAASLAVFALQSAPVLAADDSATKPQSLDSVGSEAERVSIENIKTKYWARGDENELGVVQNRLYTKARKFELGIYGGIVASDPFLSVKSVGATVAYHLNEYFALSLVGHRAFSGASTALELLQQPTAAGGLGTSANVNHPRWHFGGEAAASILYGKLSLIGKAIIHYDMHLLLGAGGTGTASGTYFTPHIGVGQQIYLTKFMSLRLDYRLMRYNENIIQQVVPSQLGQVVGQRANYSNAVTLGFSFLIDPFGKKAPAEDTSPAAQPSGAPKK